jgi:outer membrane protein TolC
MLMYRTCRRWLRLLPDLPRLEFLLATAGLSLLGLGCVKLLPTAPAVPEVAKVAQASEAQTFRAQRPDQGPSGPPSSEQPATAPQQVVACVAVAPAGYAPNVPPDPMPIPSQERTPVVPAQTAPAPTPALPQAPPAPAKVLPISLDTVLRLAEEQNTQIALAREAVREAYAEKDVAAARWLPDLYLGTGYYRHEGGIQDQDGTFLRSSTGALFGGLQLNGRLDFREAVYLRVQAERRVLQQKGELSRVTNETLLDAAGTYIDLLTARTGQAIARDVEKDLRRLLERAEKLAEVENRARVEVERIKAELAGQQQAARKLQEQAAAATAKLVYLLGLDPCTELVPVDRQLVPIHLLDASPPTGDLVNQALATGPGVQEMQALLALIQENMDRAKGPVQLLPIFDVYMAEGIFGAGPGARTDWDNRWDLGLQARWNLTEFATQRDRRRAALAKVQQAHLAYQDLRGKLTAGVQEAREAILSGLEQIRQGQEQIDHARRAYQLSDERLKEPELGATYSEVLLANRSLALAQVNYLSAVRAFDKAQLRLLLLLGKAGRPAAPVGQP